MIGIISKQTSYGGGNRSLFLCSIFLASYSSLTAHALFELGLEPIFEEYEAAYDVAAVAGPERLKTLQKRLNR